MNDKTKQILWAAGSVLVSLALVVFLHLGGGATISKGFGAIATGAGVTNLQGALSIASGNGITPGYLQVPQLSLFTSSGDVQTQPFRQAMVASTSVICSYQNPFSTASSTFLVNLNISSTSATATNLILALGANTGATTTSLGNFVVPANSFAAWSTEGTTSSGFNGIVGPGQYVNLGAATIGGSAALLQYAGVCNGTFTAIN